MRDVLLPNGYVELKTPLIFNKALWETSGHWQHYRQNMFLIDNDEEQMAMKAMNCPGHMLVFASETRSYRDLPLRFHEQTPLHRNEASGVLSGLTRVRQFAQDDAHCFVMESQIGEEVERLLAPRAARLRRLRPRVQRQAVDPPGRVPRRDRDLGSRRSRAAPRRWSRPARPTRVDEGDGAFYGPKIDFEVTDAIGRKWQCATIQLDYQLPQRFDLKYIGADNAEHRPVVIHRAIFGSFERFMALLIEHYAGAFPLWLAPVQATVLPIADRHLDAAKAVAADARGGRPAGHARRARREDRYKIREAQLQQVPYMLVMGDRERRRVRCPFAAARGGDLGARRRRGQFLDDARREVRAEGEVVIAFDRGRPPRRDDRVRINDRIRVREVRVIDETGAQLGIMAPQDAIRIAKSKGLDLVEVSATAVPPVCRITDYGRYQYNEQKRARQARKHQKTIEVKEIKFRPKVDEHDYDFKKKHIERFLTEGDKVKATVFFRGREIAHPEIGRRILERLIEEISELAIAENTPRLEGNTMHVILGRSRSWRSSGASVRRPRAAGRRAPRDMSDVNDMASDRAEPDEAAPTTRSRTTQPATSDETDSKTALERATEARTGAEGTERGHAEAEEPSWRGQALQAHRVGQIPARRRRSSATS